MHAQGLSLHKVGTSGNLQDHRAHQPIFLLCGSAAQVAGISGRFSSSSLPPSFVRGRRTTVFFSSRLTPVRLAA
jgi:hypothetical protein